MSLEQSGARPTEFQIMGQKVAKFFDAGFIGELEKEVDGVAFAHFCLYVGSPGDDASKFELVTIGHMRRAHESEGRLTVSAEDPETAEKVLATITKYLGAP